MKKGVSFEIESLGDTVIPNTASTASYFKFHSDSERVLYHHLLSKFQGEVDEQGLPAGFEVAGPRENIFFQGEKCRAAILTCGGLCPGLNAVIRGIVLQLWYFYHCKQIFGVRYGYNGLRNDSEEIVKLNPDWVRDIHSVGGTMLGTSRGAPPVDEMVNKLEALKVDMLFIIGGDGSMRGGHAIWQEVRRRGLQLAVIGVPKTIDNDIPYVHRSFGYETAVKEAAKVVNAAHVESRGAPYGIGLVKLMGRYSGYITANAVLASGNADFCLIPESPFELEGDNGLFALVKERLRRRRQVVIVVAEGAGQQFFRREELIKDASGNTKPGDIGAYLRDRLNTHFLDVGFPVTLKYIDPSYIIRSTPPNFSDKIYCDHLARAAAHAAMAGKGGMLIGNWHGHLTHVPMSALEGEVRQVDLQSDFWFSVLENTRQPYIIGPSVCVAD